MKLVRHGAMGQECPGLVDASGVVRDLSGIVPDIGGAVLSPAGLSALAAIPTAALPAVAEGVRLGAPVGGVGKLIGIGLNYADHAAEAGMKPPSEPIVFMKATSAIVGINDTVVLPRRSVKADWEVELAVVIGSPAKYVQRHEAHQYIAGYSVVNDISERELQIERGGQWTKGKSCDTFAPLGPYLVTGDEIADVQQLSLWLDVNESPMQRGSTASMIFDIAYLVSYLSQLMTLHPGDVIATGTPPGVGMGRNPQQFLGEGDVIELGIESIGSGRQEVAREA